MIWKWKFRETHLEVNKELIFDICGNKVILSQNKNIQIVYEKECFDKFILNWFLFGLFHLNDCYSFGGEILSSGITWTA